MPRLEDTYHWALIVGPKKESENSHGKRFHAKESLGLVGSPPTVHPVWQYEELDIGMAPTSMLLVRVVVGRVKSMSRLRSAFESVPVRGHVENWNCVEWVKEALLCAIQDGGALGASVKHWEPVRDAAMWYVKAKTTAHRFDGTGHYDLAKVPTWDMLDGVELVP
ncbi:hypothetical protein FZEAL_846 [Fusarium zealandicum]|uniref:Uncharacterized protein n=1 Tax=Fusarium zealandicum TaxID=1053134 RepID=A0A8H4UU54_9HYPO|nr:hypothetical protein FZEAL_846 [Fusarium zealandicum]